MTGGSSPEQTLGAVVCRGFDELSGKWCIGAEVDARRARVFWDSSHLIATRHSRRVIIS